MVDQVPLNIVPDSGAGVKVNDSGNVNITGYPVGTGNLKGIKTINTGSPANTFMMSNLRDLSPYVVGSNANQSQFINIQSAINQAVADGATSTNQKNVILTDYSYAENVVCAPGVNLVSIGGNSIIIGNTTFTPSASNQSFSSLGVTYQTPASPSGAAFSIAGSNSATLTLINNTYLGTTGTAFECLNPNAVITRDGCIARASSGQKLFNVTSTALINNFNCDDQSTDTPSTFSGTGEINFFSGFLTDSFLITGSQFIAVNCDLVVTLSTFELFNIGISASVFISNADIDCNSTSGFWATGTGTLTYAAITPIFGSSNTIDPALTITPVPTYFSKISFDSGLTLLTNLTAAWNAYYLQDTPIYPTTPTTEQILQFNGTGWTPIDLGSAGALLKANNLSDLTNVADAQANIEATSAVWNANELQGIPITSAISPSDTQALVFNGSMWVPTTVSGYTYWDKVNNAADTSVTVSAWTDYMANNPDSVVTYTVPILNIGDTFDVQLSENALGWQIIPPLFNKIAFGQQNSSAGTSGGYIASNSAGCCVRIKCTSIDGDLSVVYMSPNSQVTVN